MKVLAVLAKDDPERKKIRKVLRAAAACEQTPFRIIFTDQLAELAAIWEKKETGGVLAILGAGDADWLREFPAGERAGVPNAQLVRETVSYGRKHFETGMEAARRVRILIRLYYRTEGSVSAYAEAVHLSPTYLCRLFRKLTGETVGGFIWRLRMEDAAKKLADPDAEVRSVAVSVGYPNLPYFYRRFRSFFHMSPEEFRRQDIRQTADEEVDRARGDGREGDTGTDDRDSLQQKR